MGRAFFQTFDMFGIKPVFFLIKMICFGDISYRKGSKAISKDERWSAVVLCPANRRNPLALKLAGIYTRVTPSHQPRKDALPVQHTLGTRSASYYRWHTDCRQLSVCVSVCVWWKSLWRRKYVGVTPALVPPVSQPQRDTDHYIAICLTILLRTFRLDH